MTKRILAPLNSLTTHPDFDFRGWHDTAHLRDLRQVLTSNPRKAFDPILAWKDPEDEKLYVLDGQYRAEAYRQVRQEARKVPIMVFEGSREEAILASLRANAKAKLPLTSQERQNAAWRLVRLPEGPLGPTYSKPLIADAAGVSPRQVSYMRVRWKEIQAQGQEALESLTGRWAADRDTATPKGDYELLSDAQREQQIKALSEQLRDVTDRRKHGGALPILGDQHAVYEAFSRAYGELWVKGFLEFTLGDEADDWGSPLALMMSDDADEEDEPQF